MPWVRLDDEFPEHPKLISVGPLGMMLQVAALCYSNAHLTDGFIQFNVVSKLLCWEFSPPGTDLIYTVGLTSGMQGEDVDSKMVAEWLVNAGIWEPVSGGYKIHDYTDYQMTKEQIYALHETRTAVGKLGGRPKKANGNQIANQSETNLVSKTKAKGNQTLNQTSNQNESKTKPQSQSQSQSDDPPIKVIKGQVKRDRAPRQPAADLYPIADALAKVCQMDLSVNRGRLFREAKLLFGKVEPLQLIKDYGLGGIWYLNDWRGKRGELPNPSTIRETLGRLNGNGQHSDIPDETPEHLEARRAAFAAMKGIGEE